MAMRQLEELRPLSWRCGLDSHLDQRMEELMNYAYWRKCDFQVHSPRDPNWTGPSLAGDAERLQWAREFIDQCVSKQLKAVALTDHNDMVMAPFVQKAIEERKGNDPEFDLWFFPGMEITARGRKQCIIIFDTDLSEERREQVQGKLGILYPDSQEDQVAPSPVRQLEVSYPQIASLLDELEGLRGKYIVLPNVSQGGSHTVLTHGEHKDFLSMPYFGGYLDGGQTIETLGQRNRRRLSGNNSTWSRRFIYPLPTSDSRSADFSTLGTNDTWIKVAEPTAEAIRQAFLAHQSRIRIEKPNLPSSVITKVRVESSTILDTTVLELSPEFNAIIGGRGSGKSTFLEYVAFVLGRSSSDMPRDHYAGTKRMRTLIDLFRLKNGCVSLEFKLDNSLFRIVREPGTSYRPKIIYEDKTERIVSDQELRRLFPAVVYSQGELADVGGRNGSKTQLSDLLQFVDPNYKRKDDQSRSAIKSAKGAVRSAIRMVVQHWELLSRRRQLQTKTASLIQRAEALEKTLPKRSEEDNAILTHYDAATKFNVKVTQASQHIDKLLQRLSVVDSELRSERDLTTSLDGIATTIQERYRDFYMAFKSGMTRMLDRLRSKRTAFKTLEDKWKLGYKDVSKRRKSVLEKFGNQQAVTSQIIKLRDEITQLQNQITNFEEKIKVSDNPLNRLRSSIDELRRISDERDRRTQEWAATIESLSSGKIKATVTLADDIEEIREAIDIVAAKTRSYESIRRRNLDQALKGRSASKLIDDLRQDCLNLLEWRQMGEPYGENRPKCSNLMSLLGETKNIRDLVTKLMDPERAGAIATAIAKPGIALHFCDGNREISFDNASDGQRAAALLFMLLEQSSGPLIIDQPEGDLDNRIITELTEKLHFSKEKRQLLFSSHNANLIVNGSAEIVGQLDVTDAGGRQFACIGAIDRPDVCKVITSTMEGGEKAFRDRKEKYGF